MQIRTFDAATMAKAQAGVRDALGVDALILAIEETAGGVRITAAIEPEDDLAGLLADDAPEPDPRLGPLMAFHGVPSGLRAPLACAAAGARLEPGLALALKSRLRAGAAADRRLLVGLPGHGKSLAGARLATALAAVGPIPRVLALHLGDDEPDPRLAARLAGAGLEVTTITSLAELTAAAGRPGPIVVDTPGLSPLTSRGAGRLRDLVRAAGDLVPTLVLSVEGQGQALLETAADFLALGCRAVLPTKLDLTRRYGGLVALACGGIALAPASVSGDATEPLVPLQPAGLARLLVNRFEAHAAATRAEEGQP